MRSASAELIAAIAAQETTLCALWDVERVNGTHLRFTDTDKPVTFDGETYRADVSFNASAILTSASFANAQTVTIETVLSDDAITEEDVRAQRYKGATGTVTIVDWAHPEYGGLIIFKGTFGQVKLTDKDRLIIELTPGSVGGKGYVGIDRYQMTCRALLGDAKCTVDLDALKVAFTVDSVTSPKVFVASELTQADEHWKIGVVKWLTGDNAGSSSPVYTSDQSSTNITLGEPPTFAIAPGDTGEVFPGCDRQLSTCNGTFNNVLNFRGEPYVPQSIYYKAPTMHFVTS
jgi:uncharacterized phage protein (TIGR02218 family)